jgi:hypothetical protein
MVRGSSIVLGIGLVILWLVGLSNHATAWLTWFDGLAALCAFGIAAAVSSEHASTSVVSGGPIALAMGLYVLWIVGLATHAEHWLSWWTFAFATAFLVVGVSASMQRPVITTPRTVT